MKKILLSLLICLLPMWVSADCIIKKVDEFIAFKVQAVDSAGVRRRPDSIHVVTYLDAGTAKQFTTRSVTYPFSDISVDSTIFSVDTNYYFVDQIQDIDGTPTQNNYQLAVTVTCWTKNIPWDNNYCAQVVPDSLDNYLAFTRDSVNTALAQLRAENKRFFPKRGVTAATTGTTGFHSTVLTEAATDYWKNNIVVMINGIDSGLAREIRAFTTATDSITFYPALPTAPATGDSFYITSFISSATDSVFAILDSIQLLDEKYTALRDSLKLVQVEVNNIDGWNPITDNDSLIIDNTNLPPGTGLSAANIVAIADTLFHRDSSDVNNGAATSFGTLMMKPAYVQGADSASVAKGVKGVLADSTFTVNVGQLLVGHIQDNGATGAVQVRNSTGPAIWARSGSAGNGALELTGTAGGYGARIEATDVVNVDRSNHAVLIQSSKTFSKAIGTHNASTVLIANQDTTTNRDSAGVGLFIESTNGDAVSIAAGGTDTTDQNRGITVEGMSDFHGRANRREGGLLIYGHGGLNAAVTIQSDTGQTIRISKNDGTPTNADTAIQVTGGSSFYQYNFKADSIKNVIATVGAISFVDSIGKNLTEQGGIAGATITWTVYAVDSTGTPATVSGVLVGIQDGAGTTRDSKTTGAGGSVVFTVTSGTWTVLATAQGYSFITRNKSVTVNQTDTIKGYDIPIPAPPTSQTCIVRVFVKNTDGSPAVGVTISAYLERSNAVDSTGTPVMNQMQNITTDANGLSQFTCIWSSYLIPASDWWFSSPSPGNVRKKVTIPRQSSYTVNFSQ